MTQESINTPPAIQLLVDVVSESASWTDARKKVRSLLPELKRQATASYGNASLDPHSLKDPEKLDIHLHGALDPISGSGCISFPCRIKAADQITRSVGLIADRIWLTDTITDSLLFFGRATNYKIDLLIENAAIISRLSPLIETGLLRFRSPHYATCEACAQKLSSEISSLTKELSRKFRRDFKLELSSEGGYLAHTGKCFEPPMIFRDPYAEELPRVSDFVAKRISEELRAILFVAREASMTGGTVFSNSRLGLAGLLQQEGRLVDKRSLILMEKNRELNIPWVSELLPSQIIQLREEAADALPLFRLQLLKAFAADSFSDENQIFTTIEGLRHQAAEVRAELDAKRKHSSRYWKVAYGLLGFGLSAYGIGTDNVAAGIGGLLPIIQLLIAHQSGYETDLAKLTTRPGYVLLKAKDILAHAH